MKKRFSILVVAALVALQARADADVPFSLHGLQAGDKVVVSIGSDGYLDNMTIEADGDFAFRDVPTGEHSVKAEAAGYNVQDAQTVVVGDDGTIAPAVGLRLVVTRMDVDTTRWAYSWHEDGSVAGYTTTAHVVTPPVVEFLGRQIVPADVPSFGTLQNEYRVLLADDEEPWTQEYAYRLVETFKTLPINYYEQQPAKFVLTAESLADDISIAAEDGGAVVRLSKDAFQYANPFVVSLDGVRGRFFSKRLHHALVEFVTDYGRDDGRANKILRDRFGCQIEVPDYAALTSGTTNEDAGRFQKFVPSELVSIINMLEELPDGFHQTPHLNYLLRRRNGQQHPLYPDAVAVAWCKDDGYIEFLEAAFGGNNQQFETQRLILHEKTHFLWAYSFSEAIRADWTALGGWYPDPNSPSQWSTTKDTEFVTAYAHEKNPNEDMAESVAYYLKNPAALMSRAPEKYDFIRDRIMHGTRYVSHIPDHLTFEVLNLYPDYDFPGKIKRLDVTVEGEPEGDKAVTVEVELVHLDGYDDGATRAFTRIAAPKIVDADGKEYQQYVDLYLDPVDGDDHTLRGRMTISKYSRAGYWVASNMSITDSQGNSRYEGRNDYVWNMYVNNPLEDLEPPHYESGSLAYTLSDTTHDGHAEQNLRVSYHLTDNVGIKRVYVGVNRAESDYTYQAFGTYDPATEQAYIDMPITEYFPSGDYYAVSIIFADSAGTERYVYFTDSPLDEPIEKIHIETSNPDTTAPELDLNRLVVYAEPTHPDNPDGETLVTITYYARDDKSGFDLSSYILLDPQGMTHFGWGQNDTNHRYFDGDPTAWHRYTINTILPQGSAPGIWGLAEMYLADKAGNGRAYNFVETLIFEPDDDDSDYAMQADIDQSGRLSIRLTSATTDAISYKYRVICDETGEEMRGSVTMSSSPRFNLQASDTPADASVDLSAWPDGKVIVIVEMLDGDGSVHAVRTRTLQKVSSSGIEPLADRTDVVRKAYFDMSGRAVVAPSRGAVVERTEYADGQVTSRVVYIR